MELWIILVIIAQFLYAVVVVIDKYIVSTPSLPRPSVYAFYVAMLSFVAVLALPIGFFPISEQIGSVSLPANASSAIRIFGYSLISGALFIGGMMLLFSALRRSEASDAIPVVGSASAIITFIMGHFFFDDPLPENFYLGFVLLVLGTALISHYRFRWRGLLVTILSGFLLGSSTMFIKLVFEITTFVDGFFWTRMGNVVAGSALLLVPSVFYAVTRHEREPARRAGKLILLSKAVSGGAFILILIAISQGSLPIINAMQGLQFVFLLVLASGCTFWMPLCFQDAESDRKMVQKIIAVGIVVAGFFALFI